MDKYDKAFADYKRRKRQKRILVVLGVAFCMAMVNMFA